MYIETYVFFDIETTGLPHLEKNQTKITELTFVAASRRDIEATTLGQQPCVSKLSLIFNPQKSIQSEVVKLTGLSNFKLRNQSKFENQIQTINSFLESLVKPVCLVAHNGNRFDYKILRAEYFDANESLPQNIYCVDSLTGFRKILKETDLCYDVLNESIENDILTDDDEEWPALNTSAEEWAEIDQLVQSMTKLPKFKKDSSPTASKKNIDKIEKKQEKIVCTLSALYKRLLNKNVQDAHRAEVDCMMLLDCVVAAKTHFLPWADDQCKLIDQIEPLRR